MSEFMIKLGCFVTSLVLMVIPFFTGYFGRKDTNSLVVIGLFISIFELLALMLIMWRSLGVW